MLPGPDSNADPTPAPRKARLRGSFLFLAAAATVAAGVAACEGDGPSERVFVETLGRDTISVERFTRSTDGIEGELVIRTPSTRIVRYEASLDEAGDIAELTVDWSVPGDGEAEPADYRMAVEGDSATVEQTGGENPGTRGLEVPPGVIPTVGRVNPLAYALLDHLLRQAEASGSDTYEVSLLVPGAPPRIQANRLTRRDDGSWAIEYFGNPFVLEPAEDGSLVRASGSATTFQVETSRSEELLDVGALASDFAARDGAGEGLGVPSPAATVEGSVDGASISVEYSQPAMRGREIWGGLVPYDEVWRTGANAATHLTTDQPIVLGDIELQAGTYTLWSTYTPDSGTLIVNEQTGQWGTQHDPEQDMDTTSMESESLDQPVERFTIDVEETDDGGRLTLAWDETRWSVPIRVP